MSQIIFFAIPVFIILTVIEYTYGKLTCYNTYRLNDTISSLSQGLLSQAIAACTPLFQIGFYSMLYHALNHGGRVFWENWYGITIAVVIYDFCDYWLHYSGPGFTDNSLRWFSKIGTVKNERSED